ncbi:MAG: efflux RND transporter periplasmic adaptor subunit [Lacipirellulaceae bacterium]
MRNVVAAAAVILLAVAAGFAGRPLVDAFRTEQQESNHGHDHDGHADHDASDHQDDHDHDHDGNADHDAADHAKGAASEHDDHVPLTTEAVANLRLELADVTLRDYQRSVRIPAEVVELPGVSEGQVAAPVEGVVTEVIAVPGVSVEPGDVLFRMRVTDERLVDAQLQLLEAITRREIVEAELERLAPYAETGAVAGRKRIDLEYELRELSSRVDLKTQELLGRGLPQEQVDRVRATRKLADTVEVRLPPREGIALNELRSGVEPAAFEADADGGADGGSGSSEMTVEELFVNPGQSVARGDALCDLAHHRTLFLRGSAFEGDMEAISAAAAADARVAAQFNEGDYHNNQASEADLPIRFVANHVDPQTQTYEVYVTLPNEVLNSTRDAQGRTYRTWRYKVGQRAHVVVPTERLSGQIVLPTAAVVVDGPLAYVFREHVEPAGETADEPAHDHDDAHDHEGSHEDAHEEEHEPIALEVEPVPVVVVERQPKLVVLAPGGELKPGDRVAITSGYQLYLAWKAQDGAGGGTDHGHDH